MKLTLQIIVLVGVLSAASCTKNVGTSSNDSASVETSDNLTFPVTNEFSGCKLRRVSLKHPNADSYINGLFTYNSAGNPFSVVFKDATDAEEPYIYPGYYFTYDKQGRLKGLHVRRIDDDTWHSYAYDANNRIIADTAKEGYGTYVGDYIIQIFVSTFTYDAQGRIIKETIKNTVNYPYDGPAEPLTPTRNPTFTYDARGNLGVNGWKSSSYDNKVSIFRSHPVFQFVFRNYSKNNSSVQSKYNSKGLPLSVTPGNDPFFFYYTTVAKAIYDCQ